MKRFLATILLGLASLGATARADVVLRDADSGKTIRVKPNESIEIRLTGNLTTGYQWFSVGGRNDSGKAFGNFAFGVLEPFGEHSYTTDAHPAGMTGVGGTDVWHFVSRTAGTETLRFIKLRPWDDKDIVERATFKVVVVP